MVKWIGALLAASMLAPVAVKAQDGVRADVDAEARVSRGDGWRGERGPRDRGGDRPQRIEDRSVDPVRADEGLNRRRIERGPRPFEGAPSDERPPLPSPPVLIGNGARPADARPDPRVTARRDDGPARDDSRWDGRRADPERRRFEAGAPERQNRDWQNRDGRDRSSQDGRWRDRDGQDDRGRLDGRDRRDDREWQRRDGRDWRGGRDWNAGRDWGTGRDWNDRRRGWDDNARWDGDRRGGGRWDRGWRAQQQYDWSRYRNLNRNAFRLPRYYAPYGWTGGYRRFSVGIGLSDGLWDQNYWIADPFAYRLPEVYGPYRWVRYYDDALLVDIRTGIVVDAVYDIFW